MTGNEAPPTAAGPPWPLELLADLHADLFDESTAAELRAAIAADPEASAALAALDATRADLAALPPLRMPDDVAARIDAALREEAAARVAGAGVPPMHAVPPRAGPRRSGAAPPLGAAPRPADLGAAPPPGAVPSAHAVAPVVDLAAARERRRRRGLLIGGGLLTAAAAAAGIIAVSGLTGGRTPGTPQASPPNASDQPLPPLALTKSDLPTALDDALSASDYGPLGAAGRLDACLAANRLDPATTKPLGAREVTLDGKPGVLLILPTGTATRFRLLVVSPDCGPSNPAVLAETTMRR